MERQRLLDIGGSPDGYVNQEYFKIKRENAIPRPSQVEIDTAKRKGINPRTGRDYQPEWLSVLQKREPLPRWLNTLLCDCCGRQFWMTRSQWLWTLHLICFVVHATMVFLTLYESLSKPADKFEIPVWRFSVEWNNSTATSYGVQVVENGKPIRFDWLVAVFFGISAIHHGIIVFLGPWDRFIWAIWRQIDLGFNWLVWLEYMISAPTMVLAVCLLIGIREENTLASLFMLTVATIFCGLLTEIHSKPHRNADGTFDFSRWAGELPQVKPDIPAATAQDFEDRQYGRMIRQQNYFHRMIPCVFGLFLFMATWIQVIHYFLTSIDDVRERDPDLAEKIPWFVPVVVFGIFLLFLTFPVNLIWHQWLPPKHYYKTEIWWCVLSLTSKLFLGLMIYFNVLRMSSFSEAVALD